MDRLSGESDKAFLAFQCYVRSDRTVRGAWNEYRKAATLDSKNPSAGFIKWVTENRWADRAAGVDIQRRTDEELLALEIIEGRESELAAFACKVALGEVDISSPQASILKHLMGQLFGPKRGTAHEQQIDEPVADKSAMLRLLRGQ